MRKNRLGRERGTLGDAPVIYLAVAARTASGRATDLLHCAAAKLLGVEAKKQSLSTLDCPESSRLTLTNRALLAPTSAFLRNWPPVSRFRPKLDQMQSERRKVRFDQLPDLKGSTDRSPLSLSMHHFISVNRNTCRALSSSPEIHFCGPINSWRGHRPTLVLTIETISFRSLSSKSIA